MSVIWALQLTGRMVGYAWQLNCLIFICWKSSGTCKPRKKYCKGSLTMPFPVTYTTELLCLYIPSHHSLLSVFHTYLWLHYILLYKLAFCQTSHWALQWLTQVLPDILWHGVSTDAYNLMTNWATWRAVAMTESDGDNDDDVVSFVASSSVSAGSQ